MNNTEILNDEEKLNIARSFGKSASYYDSHADLQKETARRLIASLKPWKSSMPAGPILEIGCGTGFVTEGLLELFPERSLEITDLSEPMVEFCREKFGGRDRLLFEPLDVEQLDSSRGSYALTISNFVAQWLKHPAITLGKCLEATVPGGLLLASFPGSESFPEWKKNCREVGLPYTGNALPDTEEIVVKLSGGPVQVDYYEDTVTRRYKSAADFFRHLKMLGAGTQRGGRRLTPKEMRILIDHWDTQSKEDIDVSYHVVFVAVKRNYDS